MNQNRDENLLFYQLFESESSTYTYLLADTKTQEAVLIDPVLEMVERDLKLIEELGLKLKYILDTHVHADHITGAGKIRKITKAQTAVSANAHLDCVDISLADGQVLKFGEFEIQALATPGHTDSCLTYLCQGMAFTGDSLMIRACGRTDFQQGSSRRLYESVTQKLFSLPGKTVVYPAHDYRGQTKSTIEMEKKWNLRLGANRTETEFIKIMSELKLALPKKIHEAVPANLACGEVERSPI